MDEPDARPRNVGMILGRSIPKFAALLGLLASLIGTSRRPTVHDGTAARVEDFEPEVEGLRLLLGLPAFK